MTQSSQERASANCAYCQGTGQVNSEGCRACAGKGNVMVAQPAKECAHCHGKGKKSAYRCNFCRGTGWAHAQPVSA